MSRLFWDDFFDFPIGNQLVPFVGNANSTNATNSNNNQLASFYKSQQQMSVDFVEKDKEYELHADLPGYNKDDISVNLDNGVLSMEASRHGDKSEEKETKTGKYYYRERFSGTVHRSFRLPANANGDDAKVNYDNGVLTVSIPKRADANTKKLTIN